MCVCVCVAAKSELSESCAVDRQCGDVNAVCENAVCTCRPGYTAQQDTCSMNAPLISILADSAP